MKAYTPRETDLQKGGRGARGKKSPAYFFMKKKIVIMMLSMAVAATAMPMYAFAADDEPAVEAESEEGDSSEATEETEEESETESDSDFVEGSAVLADYDYKAGEMTDSGWANNILKMAFTPADGITLDEEENDKLNEYYERNGEDKQVAVNEFVATSEEGDFIQMMVEVNPNRESAEDILNNFMEEENLELPGKVRETEIAGKQFRTCSGVIDKEKFYLAVSTESPDVAIAMKIKYTDTDARKAFTDCFTELKDEEDSDAETDSAEEDAEETEENAEESAEETDVEAEAEAE